MWHSNKGYLVWALCQAPVDGAARDPKRSKVAIRQLSAALLPLQNRNVVSEGSVP